MQGRVPPRLFTHGAPACDRVTHNFGKIPQRCSVVLGIVPNSVFFPKNNADNSGYLHRLMLDEGLYW